jgi:hypothetical protein
MKESIWERIIKEKNGRNKKGVVEEEMKYVKRKVRKG